MPHTERGVVVVTGGSGVIGRATVARYISEGWRTISVDRVPFDPDAWRGSLAGALPPPVWAQADLSIEAQAVAAFLETVGHDPVNHLVAIAGGADEDERQGGRWTLPKPDVFRASLESNLLSAYISIAVLLPNLRAAVGDRSITLCGSINALAAWSYVGYSASKAGLMGLAHVLADILAPDGIRCNVLALGSVSTRVLSEMEGQVLSSSVPLGRMATPGEAADAFYALAVSMRHVTGQTIVVDGGQEIHRWRPAR